MTSQIATSAINGPPHNDADAAEQIFPSQAVVSLGRRSRTVGGVSVMTGRPTLYTAEIAERILDELSDGRTLAEICAAPGMPSCRTVQQWSLDDREGFAARYSRAREIVIGRTRARGRMAKATSSN